MRVAVFVPTLSYGDAISGDAMAMASLLGDLGHHCWLTATAANHVEATVYPYREALPDAIERGGLLIYHHGIYFPEAEELVQPTSYRKILRYHNVTPPEHFHSISAAHVRLTTTGRRQTQDLLRHRFDFCLANSDYSLRELLAAGAPADRCLAVPPFHQTERLASLAPDPGVLKRFGNGQPNWLCVGRLSPHKNHGFLLQAFAAFKDQAARHGCLLIVGSEDPGLQRYNRELHRQVAAYGLEEHVHFVGKVSEAELRAYYQVASVLVSASLHEGFCVPLVEAMALGVPIVALPYAAVPETVGGAGVLPTNARPAIFAQEVSSLLQSRERQQELTAVGKERYAKHFHPDAIAQKFLKVVERFNTSETDAIQQPQLPKLGLSLSTVGRLTQEHIDKLRASKPPRYQGRGIIICAGGVKYYVGAWVTIRMLRRLGCRLPIQVWYRGEAERDDDWARLVEPWGVECVDAENIADGCRTNVSAWPIKPFAMLHAPFEEVLLLDADNVPVVDPTFLFDVPEYQRTGAVFWPDLLKTPQDSIRWQIFDVSYRDEWEQESGQVLVNKNRCWQALSLCHWYNERASFFYQFVHGDKDTFRLAWHRLGCEYAMPWRTIELIPYTLCQHDFSGRRIFQHRSHDKWSLAGNAHSEGFWCEQECFDFVDELRRSWHPLRQMTRHVGEHDLAAMPSLARSSYELVRPGYNRWPLSLAENGIVNQGWSRDYFFWWPEGGDIVLAGSDGRPTARLTKTALCRWDGVLLRDERVQLQLVASEAA